MFARILAFRLAQNRCAEWHLSSRRQAANELDCQITICPLVVVASLHVDNLAACKQQCSVGSQA